VWAIIVELTTIKPNQNSERQRVERRSHQWRARKLGIKVVDASQKPINSLVLVMDIMGNYKLSFALGSDVSS